MIGKKLFGLEPEGDLASIQARGDPCQVLVRIAEEVGVVWPANGPRVLSGSVSSQGARQEVIQASARALGAGPPTEPTLARAERAAVPWLAERCLRSHVER